MHVFGRVNTLDVNPNKDRLAAQIEAARRAAESQKLSAEGQASATEQNAAAEAKAIEARAQANADATRLAGAAEAAAMRAKVDAIGGSGPYVQTLYAAALGRWNGTVPQTMLGGGGGDKGLVPFLPLGLPPASTGRSAP